MVQTFIVKVYNFADEEGLTSDDRYDAITALFQQWSYTVSFVDHHLEQSKDRFIIAHLWKCLAGQLEPFDGT